jgi:hypothetical protein
MRLTTIQASPACVLLYSPQATSGLSTNALDNTIWVNAVGGGGCVTARGRCEAQLSMGLLSVASVQMLHFTVVCHQ